LEFEVYPSPARDEITVAMFNVQCSIFNVEIYNMLGEIIYSQHLTTSNLKLHTSNWSDGIYLMKISSAQKTVTQKIIITK
jgi:hypothetical protein